MKTRTSVTAGILERYKLILVYILLGFIVLLLGSDIYFSSKLIPIPDGDATLFYPISVNYARNHLLAHPTFSPIESGTNLKFTWHGWLYPMLLSWISIKPTITSIVLSDSFIATVCVILGSGIVYGLSKQLPVTLIVSIILYNFTLSVRGRPEVLAGIILLSIFYVTWANLYSARYKLLNVAIIGILFGILCVTQPTVAALGLLIFVTVMTKKVDFFNLFRYLFILATTCIATLLALTYLFYPYRLQEWFSGLLAHSQMISSRVDSSGLSYYYLFNPIQPMIGLWFIILCILSFIASSQRNTISFARNTLFYMLLIVTLTFMWYTSIRIPATNYNLVALLIPGAVLYINYTMQERLQKFKYPLLAFLIAMTVISMVTVVRYHMQNFYSRQEGVLYDEFKNDVKKYASWGSISVPRTFGAVLEEIDSVTIYPSVSSDISTDYLLIKQVNTGLFAPPQIDRYQIVVDKFISKPLSLFGITITRTPKAFNYALYQRITTTPIQN